MLPEEIETVIEAVNSEGSAAFASGKHKEAEATLARVKVTNRPRDHETTRPTDDATT